MSQVTVTNILRRANNKLQRIDPCTRICTSRGWQMKTNFGRWHVVKNNVVQDWFYNIEQLQCWAHDMGVLHYADTVVEG